MSSLLKNMAEPWNLEVQINSEDMLLFSQFAFQASTCGVCWAFPCLALEVPETLPMTRWNLVVPQFSRLMQSRGAKNLWVAKQRVHIRDLSSQHDLRLTGHRITESRRRRPAGLLLLKAPAKNCWRQMAKECEVLKQGLLLSSAEPFLKLALSDSTPDHCSKISVSNAIFSRSSNDGCQNIECFTRLQHFKLSSILGISIRLSLKFKPWGMEKRWTLSNNLGQQKMLNKWTKLLLTKKGEM